ncbi:MAG: hypothetical protein Q9187_001555 [Circinaria calcarea]
MPGDRSNELDSLGGHRSPDDTIPNTPLPLEGQESSHILAYLTPFNRQARLAFDHAVDAIKTDPDLFAYARRNMDIWPVRQESASAASIFTDSDTAEVDIAPDIPIYRYDGAYHIRLSNPPRNSKQGWTLGDGRNSGDSQVDILLSGPRNVPDIAGVHAFIFPHKESCRFVLRARHTTTVHNFSFSQRDVPCQRELAKKDEIRIGNCVYSFTHDEFVETKEHQEQLEVYMKKTHGLNWESLSAVLGPNSDLPQIKLHAYSWPLGAFAKGTFGQVTAGTRNDGKPIAVKRFNKPKGSELSAHREIMACIGKHPNILELLDCFAGPSTLIAEAYCIYQPLASGNLYDKAKKENFTFVAQVSLFREYLTGLAFLHEEKGVMHRDIKPINLGVVGMTPPRGVIFDLDSATRDETSTDHFQGTLSYLAPEIVALKEWERDKRAGKTRAPPPPYGRKVDVWALGMSAYTIYCGRAIPNDCITANVYKIIRRDLEGRINEALRDGATIEVSFIKAVQRMLAWTVHERSTAIEALEVFKELDGDKDEEPEMDSEGPRIKRQQLKKPIATGP